MLFVLRGGDAVRALRNPTTTSDESVRPRAAAGSASSITTLLSAREGPAAPPAPIAAAPGPPGAPEAPRAGVELLCRSFIFLGPAFLLRPGFPPAAISRLVMMRSPLAWPKLSAVSPSLETAFTSACAPRSWRTQSCDPELAANMSGVYPAESCTLSSAPLPISCVITSSCPFAAAKCSGVWPSSFWISTSALKLSKLLTHSTAPDLHARCSGVSPETVSESTSALASSSASRASRWPPFAALWIGFHPVLSKILMSISGCESRSLRAFVLPLAAARCAGVSPSLSWALIVPGGQALSMRIASTLVFLTPEAMCKGSRPWRSIGATLAP
eukprot:comp22399_c0_seq2/m.54491 comp22399_c0_seq2/g.54491  ORF comp22399_c0_seq2/g.54491 comp22399_c0_seq2/m.54491 type:complete len:329 (+) comp22399_c0_seq2:305-1291(+)